MPPISEQLSENGKPWPSYFLVRTTGEVVPLIAVDELPHGTDLDGVPRSLDLEDTIGMLNLGLQRSSGLFYQVVKREEKKAAPVDLPIRFKAGDGSRSQTNPARSSDASLEKTSTSHSPPVVATPAINAQSISPPQGPSLRLPPAHGLPETQTCRHWCAHGICKWGQHCRYRHIMPMSLSGLQEVGLADWPSWYRALNPGYFASGMTGPIMNSQRLGSARRPRGRACSGNTCCGGMHVDVGGHGHIGEGQAVRGGSRQGRVRGVGYGRLRKENTGAGAQVLERLRNMPRDGVKVSSRGLAEKEVSGNVLLEKAAIKETRNWEEESDESEADENIELEDKKVKAGKEKLVDV